VSTNGRQRPWPGRIGGPCSLVNSSGRGWSKLNQDRGGRPGVLGSREVAGERRGDLVAAQPGLGLDRSQSSTVQVRARPANRGGPDSSCAFPIVRTLMRYTGLSERMVWSCPWPTGNRGPDRAVRLRCSGCADEASRPTAEGLGPGPVSDRGRPGRRGRSDAGMPVSRPGHEAWQYAPFGTSIRMNVRVS
jgi:hypothetical protein